MNYLALRRQNLLRAMAADGADAFLATAAPNVTYLTGFSGDSSYFVLTPKNAVLVTDARFGNQADAECPGVDVVVRSHEKNVIQATAEVIAKAGLKAVAFESNRMPVADRKRFEAAAPKATFVEAEGRVEALRAIKDPGEVEQIRAAVQVAEKAFRMFIATVRETDTEKDMADALDGYVRRCGGRGTPFPPIVAVGDRGAVPHAVPSTTEVLGEYSKLLVDWGADLGYKADITRTLLSPYQTTPTRKNKFERVGYDLRKVYAAVLAAQTAALEAIRPGVKAKDVDAAARKALEKAGDKLGLGKYFTHGLGHGIGLEVHEGPRVRADSDDVLEQGMVITIEPGVYIPERKEKDRVVPAWGGVRIEDDVLVTRDGCQLLTTLPRELGALG